MQVSTQECRFARRQDCGYATEQRTSELLQIIKRSSLIRRRASLVQCSAVDEPRQKSPHTHKTF